MSHASDPSNWVIIRVTLGVFGNYRFLGPILWGEAWEAFIKISFILKSPSDFDETRFGNHW